MDSKQKIYYLETNAIYSLVNSISLFGNDVATSLFTYEELISGIDSDSYQRRKVLISKLSQSKLLTYPYLPVECIAKSFGLDISSIPAIVDKKMSIMQKVKLVKASNDFDEYVSLLRDNGMDYVHEIELDKKNEKVGMDSLNSTFKYNYINLKDIDKKREEEPEFYKIDISKFIIDFEQNNDKPQKGYLKEKEILVQLLNALGFAYGDSDIEDTLCHYDGKSMIAFLLGQELYTFDRSYHKTVDKKGVERHQMLNVGRNDIPDLWHLLYLRDENYVIVSDDEIFENATLGTMRIKCNDFLLEYKNRK